MITFRNIMFMALTAFTTAAFTACDDGAVNEVTPRTSTNGYNVKIIGTFKGVNTWSGNYSVAVACYDADNAYSTLQSVLPTSDDGREDTITLDNVPASTATIELAVVNRLRKRVATLYSFTMPQGQNRSDAITINFGNTQLGMFQTINNSLFQNTSLNCAQCHAAAHSAANLNLSEAEAYRSLVGVTSAKDPNYARVKPGDAENSYLYKVLSTGTDEVRYSHVALMADHQSMLDILKEWIDNGAEE